MLVYFGRALHLDATVGAASETARKTAYMCKALRCLQ